MRTSKLEEQFAALLKLYKKIPPATREYKFLDDRRFRFDFAWPNAGIAVEIDGGMRV